MRKRALLRAVACAVAAVACAAGAWADEGPNTGVADPISLDRQSPSVVTFGNVPGDIYGEAVWPNPPGLGWDVVGGVGPILHIADFSYGLGAADNSDGHSNGEANPQVAPVVYFSGCDLSMGMLKTEYRWQANLGQAAGDRFVTNGPATLSPAQVMAGLGPAAIAGPVIPGRPSINLLSLNQDWYYEIPSVRPFVPNPYVPGPNETAMDDMDALELTPIDRNGNFVHDAVDTPIYFSLDPTSPVLGGGSPADVLLTMPGAGAPAVFAPAPTMGLIATDDVDALAVYDINNVGQLEPAIDYALFSLAPNSPYLAGPDGLVGTADDFSPADIFVTDFANRSLLYLPANAIGMQFTDNVDALDVELTTMPEVFEEPEPTCLVVLALGSAALIRRRRRA